MNAQEKPFSPPYNVPWATFLTTIEKIGADLPNRLDRSYLGSASGGLKSYLIGAFKNFGLIGLDGTVSEELKIIATQPERRSETIARLLGIHYPKAVQLGTTNATPGELETAFAEMFPSITGESREKAMRFYLSAAEFAKVQRSPLWKSAKAGTSGPRKRANRLKPPNGWTPDAPGPASPAASLRTFALPSGRMMSVSVEGDVLTLDRADRKFVMEIIEKIEDHVEGSTTPGPHVSDLKEDDL